MKAAHVAGKGGQRHIVDGEVEIVGADLAFVGQGEAGRTCKRHLEVGVERLDGRNGQQSRLIGEILAQAQTEEVADGDLDRGRGFAVPPGAQDEILQVHLILGVDGEPDVRDYPGPRHIQ